MWAPPPSAASAATAAYDAAIATIARSAPSTGSSTNAAIGGPHVAPSVLASVTDAAARTRGATV